MLRRPSRLIATILIGNELVNIGISSIAAVIGDELFHRSSPLVVTAATTAMVLPVLLIFGEITPKSIAIKIPDIWSSLAARPLAAFAWLVTPVRAVVRTMVAAITWPLGVRGPDLEEPELREAEFRSMVDVGQEEGEVGGEERRLIHNVFEFADKPAGAIMTPADKVFALSYDLPLARIVDEVGKSNYSRVPIFRGRRDNIVGILLAKDLVGHARGLRAGRTLPDLLHPAFYVPKSTRCDELFRQMQRRKMHLSIAVDEYGRTVGVVTMDDLLDELFGALHEGGEAAP